MTTLCLLLRGADAGGSREILLAMKRRGFGAGKWNGVGGKVEPGEDATTAAIRETYEEVGVNVEPQHMRHVAQLTFHDPPKSDSDIHCDIFVAEAWSGEPAESEEMSPSWFAAADIPYDSMWPDDRTWLPRVLAGERVRGEFWFGGPSGEDLVRHTVSNV